MKYPIGIQTFSLIIQDGYVYVDKTDMVYNLAKGGKILSDKENCTKSVADICFLVHPRPFSCFFISINTE